MLFFEFAFKSGRQLVFNLEKKLVTGNQFVIGDSE